MKEENGSMKTARGLLPSMILWNTEVIPVMKGENGDYYVSSRDLWQSLDVRTQFSKWFTRACGYCLLKEGVDYTRMDVYGNVDWESGQPVDTYQSKMTDNRKAAQYRGDFLLTLEAAKEIAMIQRTREAHAIRRKLIELEHQVRQGRIRESRVGERMMARNPMAFKESGLPALPLAPAAFLKKAEDLMAAMDRMDARMGAIAGDAAFGRAVADAPDLLSATQIAKEYGLSAVAFNQLLAGLGVQYKKSGQWLLYARYDGQGYTRTVYTTIVHRDNKKSVVLTTKWTPLGRKFLYGLLAGRGIEPGWAPAERVIWPTDDGERGGIDG